MRENVLQRDVEVEVETMDQRGTILGPLWVGKGGQRRNVALELLRRGLGSLIPAVAERSPMADELAAAESEARSSRRGLWRDVEEEAEAEVQAEAGEEVVEVTVCDVVDGRTFAVHVNDDRRALEQMERSLAAIKEEHGEAHAAAEPRKGKLVAVLFDDGLGDGPKWFRARVLGRAADGEGWDVLYVDYGNHETVPVTRMRPLPPSLVAVPPMARECVLSCVRAPALDAPFGIDAAQAFSDAVFQRSLVAKVHRRDDQNRLEVSLFDKEAAEPVAARLLREGLLRLSKKEVKRMERRRDADAPGAAKDWQLIRVLQDAQDVARSNRVARWQFGDIADSDDEAPR